MPCGPKCVANGEPGLECLAASQPGVFGYLRAWCDSDDPVLRRSSLDRSRKGYTPPPAYEGPAIPAEVRADPVAVGAISPIGETAETPATEPGLIRKVASFASAAGAHVAAGMPTVADAEKDRRLAVCAGCPHFDAARTVCRRCGCAMRAKAAWAQSQCPEGKW